MQIEKASQTTLKAYVCIVAAKVYLITADCMALREPTEIPKKELFRYLRNVD
jgi:hypothetical protein